MNLMHGDCFDRMGEIPAGSVDLVLVDPPYGVTNCDWDTPLDLVELWACIERVAKPASAIRHLRSGVITAVRT